MYQAPAEFSPSQGVRNQVPFTADGLAQSCRSKAPGEISAQGERHGHSVGAGNEEPSSKSRNQPFLDSTILYGTGNVKCKFFLRKIIAATKLHI
jgi:hypothetical protein